MGFVVLGSAHFFFDNKNPVALVNAVVPALSVRPSSSSAIEKLIWWGLEFIGGLELEFVGGLIVFAIGGGALYLVGAEASDPAFVDFLHSLSPWLAAHSKEVGWLAGAVIAAVTLFLPVFLSRRASKSARGSQLATVGRIGSQALVVAFCAAALVLTTIPAVAYLEGLGFFAAKRVNGL